MNSLTKRYEEIYQNIIRPYREEYNYADLGPENFEIAEKKFVRQDFQVKNPRNLSLQCSFYYQNLPILLPCVIYLHSHTGSRLEAVPILQLLLPSNINILTFDFSGSGLSEGEYISLG